MSARQHAAKLRRVNTLTFHYPKKERADHSQAGSEFPQANVNRLFKKEKRRGSGKKINGKREGTAR
jgi:hypothetical protein